MEVSITKEVSHCIDLSICSFLYNNRNCTILSQIGITFINFSGKLYVLSVRGLFAETKIASGSMVISVNTKEATCMTADECRDYIRSLSGDVTIVTTDTAAILASGRDKNYGYSFLPDNCRKVYNLDYNERIPPLLEDVGVSKEKWLKIVNLVETELLPCLTDAIELRKAMKELHGASDQGQMDRRGVSTTYQCCSICECFIILTCN